MKYLVSCHSRTARLVTNFAILSLLVWGSALAQSQKPINKDGLIDAIRLKGFSTKELVQRIKTRGVSFQMTTEIETEMRGAGAPSEVIEAARSNYRAPDAPTLLPKSLTINSAPGECQVFLDGQLRGTTNGEGVLVLRPLKPGSYKVTLRKPGYREEERRILVLPSGTLGNFFLSQLPAQLNVTSNTQGVHITIRNVGEYSDKVTNLELRPGAYEVEVSKPGYHTFTRQVLLAAGAPFFLPVTLEKMSIEEMTTLGEQGVASSRYSDAISLFNVVLAEQPGNARVNKDLGRAYYLSGNYEQSVPYFAKAVSLGDRVLFKVRHRHKLFEMCSGSVTISTQTFAFKSDDGYKEGHDFEIPYSKFKEYTLVDDIEGIRLHTKARIPKPAGRKGEDEKDNNFYTPETYRPLMAGPCPDCSRRLRVILDLIKQFAGAGG